MSEIINIAFCTDFTDVSKASLESIMFNTWNFRCNIHLIHFAENKNDTLAEANLESFKNEVALIASEGQNVFKKLFNTSQLDEMIDYLNNSNYQIIAAAMPFNVCDKKDSFIPMLIERVNKDLTLIPQGHKIKLENRATIVVDSERLDNLYLTRLFEEFYRFLHTKITIFLLSDEVLDEASLAEFHGRISRIMPNLDYTLINHDRSNCMENLKRLIKLDKIDYFVVFKGDYFEKFMLNLIHNNSKNVKWNFSLYRSYVNDEIIANLKKGIEPFPGLELN